MEGWAEEHTCGFYGIDLHDHAHLKIPFALDVWQCKPLAMQGSLHFFIASSQTTSNRITARRKEE
ncbi:unnamed protein product, partial [Pleuronectes platessa]